MSANYPKASHVGKYANRLNHPVADMERAFAAKWDETNNPPPFLNRGIGTLQHLLCSDMDGRNIERELTAEEITAAATVVQWLGTNCGFSWLRSCLAYCGYKVNGRCDE
jgi:hypothetical protein